MAEAPVNISPGMQAVRSGAAAGGVSELGKMKIRELGEAAGKSISARLGLERARQIVQGNKEAMPHVGDLASGAIRGIGNLVERRGQQLEANANKRADRGKKHEANIQEMANKKVDSEKESMMWRLAETTLQMHGLPGQDTLRAIREGMRTVSGLPEKARARWEEFWRDTDFRKSERDLTTGQKYCDGAKTIRDAADRLDDILGSKARAEQLTADAENAGKTFKSTAEREEAVRQQLEKILTEGATVGAAAVGEVMTQPPKAVTVQEQIVSEAQQKVATMGQS